MSTGRSSTHLLVILALCAAGVSPARANLIGDTITIDHYLPSLGSNGLYEAHTTVVTAGPADFTNMIGVYVVNPEADSINVHFTYGAGSWTNHAFNGLVIGSIDDALLGVTVSTNLAGWDDSRLTYDAHTIYSNWAGLSIDHGSYFNLSLIQSQGAPVPESSATLALVGAAFAALAGLRRGMRLT